MWALTFLLASAAVGTSIVEISPFSKWDVSASGAWPEHLYRDTDGSFSTGFSPESGQVAVGVVNLTMSNRAGPMFPPEELWGRTDWTATARYDGGLFTKLQLQEIAESLSLRHDMPIAAADFKVVDADGAVSASVHRTYWRYGAMATAFLFGWPGILAVSSAIPGIVLWLTRRAGPQKWHCANCGYDRTGLVQDAVCPECGKRA